MLSADEPPLNDLNDEQLQQLLGEVAPKVKELMEGGSPLPSTTTKEGGYDHSKVFRSLWRSALWLTGQPLLLPFVFTVGGLVHLTQGPLGWSSGRLIGTT